MILFCWLVLIVCCLTPTVIYLIITKKYGGEPIILKGKNK